MKNFAVYSFYALTLILVWSYMPVTVTAQDTKPKDKFEDRYYYIATTLSAKNIDSAIPAANSLLTASNTDLQRVKSLMLLATLYERTGKPTEALAFAIKGEKLAEEISNKDWMIRISGFLSTTFRELGLTTEGEKYIGIAEAASRTATTTPVIQIFIHQEKAYYAMANKQYNNALSKIRTAIVLAEKTPPQKGSNIILATCYQIAGDCYIELDSLEEAKVYLDKSSQVLAGDESELKGYIYQSRGKLALRQRKMDEAKENLGAALSYANSSKNFNLKVLTFKGFYDYYSIIGNTQEALKFQTQYTELVEGHAAFSTKVSNELLAKLDSELHRKTTSNNILYFICGLLILGITVSVAILNRVRKKERAIYLAYIAKLEKTQKDMGLTLVGDETIDKIPIGDVTSVQSSEPPLSPGSQPIAGRSEDRKDGLSIPKDTENRILKDLALLESKEAFYLSKEINLSYLSVALKTNSKYLSVIINKHKGKDFNNYINELRINHVIKKLQSDSDYLSYKISYLSEQVGFSSHSKFTAAFKNVTGISPSAFIANLKKDATNMR
jgi:AraC-like DNA-binding protein